MVRLAVAVWPPPEVVATLSALERPTVPGVHWSSPQQWMVKVRPGIPVSARWTARELAMVADRSSPHGPRFEDLLTIPLTEAGPITATRR